MGGWLCLFFYRDKSCERLNKPTEYPTRAGTGIPGQTKYILGYSTGIKRKLIILIYTYFPERNKNFRRKLFLKVYSFFPSNLLRNVHMNSYMAWNYMTTIKIISSSSFSILSNDRSKASSKTIPPHSAI